MTKLGDICTVVSGSTPSSSVAEYWDGNHIWITPAELSDDSFIIYDSVRHITDKAIQETSLKPFPEGTVILSSRAPIGKTAIAGCKMYCNQGFKNLICSDSIYNKYLYFFLSAKTDYLNSLGRGATFKEISKHIVENIEISLPDIEEQKKRAAVLEKLMFLIQARRKQLSKLDQIVKSRFVEMFGEIESNSLSWNMAKLNQVIKSCEAGWSGSGIQRQKQENEVAVLKVSSVTKGYFDFHEYKVLDDQKNIKKYIYPQKNDLIFSRANTRELVGATAIIDKDYQKFILPDKLWRIKLNNNINIYYIKYILSDNFYRKKISSISTGTSGSMFNVSMEKFKSLDIPLPPLPLQEQFAAFVQQVDKAKSSVKQSLETLETLKKSLMQEYFR